MSTVSSHDSDPQNFKSRFSNPGIVAHLDQEIALIKVQITQGLERFVQMTNIMKKT